MNAHFTEKRFFWHRRPSTHNSWNGGNGNNGGVNNYQNTGGGYGGSNSWNGGNGNNGGVSNNQQGDAASPGKFTYPLLQSYLIPITKQASFALWCKPGCGY